jgi:mannose-6-phosphate isomerase
MANSDNVVRAGLTPKFKDLETLAEILRPLPAPRIFRPAGEETVYPECEAFRLRRIRFETGRTIEMNKPDTPSVLLAVEGESLLGWSGGEDRIKRGDSLFMPAELGRFTLKAVAGSEIYAVDVPE